MRRNRGHQGLAPHAEQPFFHIAQDFSNEVVTLETAWRAASHETIVVGCFGKFVMQAA